MATSIPDKWQNYKPIGKKIKGTRFIAFKVPLKEHIAQNVDSRVRLDHRTLLKMIPKLGLIVDLTNTYRYYDPHVFVKKGVEYKKLMIPGQKTPRKDLVDKFIKIIQEFIKKNKDNDKLIGVHCTHGVNRTGYLICNYMISQMTIEPNEAINRFANARGHKIERQNYIEALHKIQNTNGQSSSIKIENSRIRRGQNDYQPENWRQHEQELRDYSNRRRVSNNRYEHQYQSYKNNSRERLRSPSHSRYSDSFSNRRPSDRIEDERPTHSAAQLRLDYYNRVPAASQRYTYVRKDL